MQLELWHITGSGFHFGRHGLGQEETRVHFPSDSLWAAILSRAAEMRGPSGVETLASALNADPPVVLSSAFPRAGQVLFYPSPLTVPVEASEARDNGSVAYKSVKQVEFVSAGVFGRLVSGEHTLISLLMQGGARSLHDGRVLHLPEERLPDSVGKGGRIYAVERRPRVAVGREGNASQVYSTGRVVYPSDCGLWFAVRWLRDDPEVRGLLTEALNELGEAGLGGERSAGFGACRIEPVGTLELPEPSSGGMWVNLSRYWPREDEMGALRHPRAAYAIESVGGWVYSPDGKNQRRRPIQLIAEGATLGAVTRTPPGQLDDVGPVYEHYRFPHPVYRVGQALGVAFRAGAQP